MNSRQISALLPLLCALTFASAARAETPKLEFPQPSPACTIKQRVGLTDVEITYSRPGVKDRQIFGSVVPYDKVWRTGANAATKVVFSTPVKLNGNDVPAGTYALMTIPGKDEWTIIVNKGSGQWGSYKYDEKEDLLRFKAKPVSLAKPVDAFTIEFDDIRDTSSNMLLSWDKISVPIKLEVDYVEKLISQIEQVMSSDEPKKPYFQAAAFYFNHGQDLGKAKNWVDAAIAEREAFYIVHLKAQILEKLGDKKGALEAAKRSNELALKANDGAYVRMNEALIKRVQ